MRLRTGLMLLSPEIVLFHTIFKRQVQPPCDNIETCDTECPGGITLKLRTLSIALLLSVAGVHASIAAPAPAPNSVQNPGSNFLPGLPGYGSAQGSIIVVYGANLGPSSLVQATTLPLQTSLSNTSITVTVGATTVNLLMVYTVASQLAAVLPSNTPVGNGTLTVTFNGQNGSTPIVVVASAVGILTANETGTGPAVATHVNNQLITSTNAANEGEEIQIYATGIDGLPGGASDASAPGAVTFSTTNVVVYVGGVQLNANALKYWGRNPSDPGLDQINIILPANVTGCQVSLVIQTGTGGNIYVSNTVTLAIAASGSTCSDPNGINVSQLTPAFNANGTASLGSLNLMQSSYTISGQSFTSANASASFLKYTQLEFSQSTTGFLPSIGSCIIVIQNSLITGTPNPPTGLDAGAQIGVMPPTGSAFNMAVNAALGKGYYGTTFGTLTQITPGAYHFTGPGGADVGAFLASLTVPPNLTWTNQAAVTTSPIVRANGVTINWTGGDPSSYAYIIGISYNNNPNNASATLGAEFICIAPISAGTFFVPPAVTLSLPGSGGAAASPFGIIALGTFSTPQKFTATGLDYAYASSTSFSGGSVVWQ